MTQLPHIAIVDDEIEITRLLAEYLQANGFRVTPRHDGRSLLQLMADDPPQLVLLDLGLPGEDGFSIARQLREHWQCGLVIVTGRGAPEALILEADTVTDMHLVKHAFASGIGAQAGIEW